MRMMKEEIEEQTREEELLSFPQTQQQSKLVVVGYALTSKKTKSFLQPKLEGLARYFVNRIFHYHNHNLISDFYWFFSPRFYMINYFLQLFRWCGCGVSGLRFAFKMLYTFSLLIFFWSVVFCLVVKDLKKE